jgi:hypothetical protein
MVPGGPRYHLDVRQLPQHEQHYPDRLLPHRLEEYVLDDGTPPTQNRAYARKVTGQQVLDAICAAQKKLGLTNIDPRYYVGTCFHEAGCVNEWDTEVASPSCPPGFVSVGAYQIGKEEAERFGFKLENMLDLDKSSECMIQLAEYNRRQIRIAAKLISNDPDPDWIAPDGTVWKGGAMRAYLAIAHNHGNGYAQKTIATYGLNWDTFKSRNPTDNIVAHGYGQDCITGGPFWPAEGGTAAAKLGDRVLYLTTPFMTGEDVRDLQRHLKLRTDASFGPLTDQAVRLFQHGHQLVEDGIVGPKTAAAILATT